MALFYVILKFMPFEYMGVVAISALFVSVPILIRYAPVATNNNPMDDVERGHFRKKVKVNLVIEVMVICLLFFIGYANYAFIISLAVFVSGVFVLVQVFSSMYKFKNV